MDQRTQEPGLTGIDLSRFGSVLLVKPGDRIGVSVDITQAAVPPSPGSVHDRARAALGLDP